jgi:hypothetical protein
MKKRSKRMRRTLSILVFLAIAGFVCLPAGAQLNTLYEQEGLAADGYLAIDASGQGPATNPNSTNWKYQYGSGSWSGVYSWDSNAWVETTETGDSDVDIECDIEMYCETTTSNNKVYFHIGNLYTATSSDKTAYVDGTMTSNNGQWIGISFDGTSKTEADFEKDGSGNFTGRILGAMVGTVDAGGRDISAESFDIVVTMTWDGGTTWNVPGSYGDGAHSTITDTLWWLVNNGVPGSYTVQWKIELDPAADQPDGNYHLDPAVVVAPVL